MQTKGSVLKGQRLDGVDIVVLAIAFIVPMSKDSAVAVFVIVPVAVELAVAEKETVTIEPGLKSSTKHEIELVVDVAQSTVAEPAGVMVKVGAVKEPVVCDGGVSVRWMS